MWPFSYFQFFPIMDHQFLSPTFLSLPCINLHFWACHCSEVCHPTLAASSWFLVFRVFFYFGFFFFFSTENFIRNKELEKILNLPCSAPLLLEREVIISCNSLNFLFLKHLLDFKLLIQFGAFKCRGRGKKGNFVYCKDANRLLISWLTFNHLLF